MGKMYGIGVGPGDPELLTLKADRLLNEADVIFCPEKAKGAGSFAFDIIKEHLKHSKAEIVDLVLPDALSWGRASEDVGKKCTLHCGAFTGRTDRRIYHAG